MESWGLARIVAYYRVAVLVVVALALMSSPAEARKEKKKKRKRAPAGHKSKAKKQPVPTPDRPESVENAEELPPIDFDVDQALAHAKALVKIGPRPSNSEGAKAAAGYIKAELEKLGLDVEEQVVGSQVAEAIDLSPMYTMPEFAFTTQDANLIVRIPVRGRSKDKPLLFMAHYDSVPQSPGAVDNAVSVGLLLELARYLKRGNPMRDIILVWTAAEENHILGAIPLAEKLAEEVGLAVSLDLLGGKGTLTLNGLGPMIGRGWLMWFAEVSKKAKVDLSAPWTHRAVSLLFPEIERSDHAPFTARGVAAMHLYHRGPERIYLPYHTKHDTMAQVDQASVQEAASLLTAMSESKFSFPTNGGNQGMWVPLPGSPKVATTLAAQALEFMFLFYALVSLVKLRREDRESTAGSAPKKDGRRLGLMAGLAAYALTWIVTAIVVGLFSGGHQLAWAHSPARFLFASLCIAGAVGYVLALQGQRLGTWVGDTRFLIPAVAVSGFVGFVILAMGVYELAWIFLFPSAALGGIGRAKSLLRGLVIWGLATLPLLGPLAPSFLRESVFHGFFPSSLSLPSYLAFFVLPQTLGLVFLVQRWRPRLPQGKGALIGCGLAAALGIVLILSFSPPCSESEYKLQGLACEIQN